MSNRYLYRVLVEIDGEWRTMRHFQTRQAAQHRAAEISTRAGFVDKLVRIERSAPIDFFPDGLTWVAGAYRGGVAL